MGLIKKCVARPVVGQGFWRRNLEMFGRVTHPISQKQAPPKLLQVQGPQRGTPWILLADLL
jgi:hypothetical protein